MPVLTGRVKFQTETLPVVHRLSAPSARFIPGVMYRNIPGFFTALPSHDRTANAPASPSDHHPVFHRLSSGLSTGCTRDLSAVAQRATGSAVASKSDGGKPRSDR